MSAPSVVFRIASEPWEFEQIHRLNHRTFAEEIPQHAPRADGRLVDRFHAENTYVIGVEDGRVVAMLAVRGRRPFSLDAKLPDLDRHLPPGRRLVEVRLLAVEPDRRRSAVFHGLLEATVRHCLAAGYDTAVVSGTLRQLRLYRHLGFEPFGPVVGTAEAPYQPMFLTLEAFVRQAESARSLRPIAPATPQPPVSFLPGPVAVAPAVQAAFARPPVSHRGREFQENFRRLRERLARYAGARRAQILLGSGSLATDCIAAQLSLLGQPGVVFSSGEFGERLADHARRARLDFTWVRRPWGHVFRADELAAALDEARAAGAGWVWAVHHETSTGVLLAVDALRALAAERGLRLCLDCISSLGSVPVDLDGVWMASGASGKGLAAYPGLALVFHADPVRPEPQRLPRYLDLGTWDAAGGIPFTHSSNLVAALDVALAAAEVEGPARFARVEKLAARLRSGLRGQGWSIMAPDEHACPAIITVALPPTQSAATLGAALEEAGFLSSYRSRYLEDCNWIQFALMGAVDEPDIDRLLTALQRHAPAGGVPAELVAAG